MSHSARYAALGLASVGLLAGGLSVTSPVYAGGYEEVDGADCLEDDDDSECRSRTWLDVDERSGKSHRRSIELSADVDFFQRDDDDGWKRAFGMKHDDDDDLGEVRFQYRWDDDDDWRTFFVEDIDEDGQADVRVRIRGKDHDDVDVRAKYSGVDDEIRSSTSRHVEID